MYIYNVTINVENTIREPWLEWMQQTHIPDMLATGIFSEARLCRVCVEEETGGTTYAVQYKAESEEALGLYYREHAARLRGDAHARFGERAVAFRTELEIVSEHPSGG